MSDSSVVYELVAWHFDADSKGLFATPERASKEADKLLRKGELIHPLYSIVAREVLS